MDKNLFSTIEVAKILGISRQAVLKKIKSGEIKAKKVGRSFIVDRKDVGGILDTVLSEVKKYEIEESVKKTIDEYGETLKLLGRE